MNKGWLVARREWTENVRTKAFWIGILVFPLILTLSIVVPKLLEGQKGVRRFAVLDRSGWLLDAVEDRAAFPDLEAVLLDMRATIRKGEPLDAYPAVLQGLKAMVAKADDAGIRAMAAGLAMTPEEAERLAPQVEAMGAGVTREDLLRGIEASREAIREWWRGLGPKKAARYGRQVSKSRYQRVDFDPTSEPDPEAALRRRVDSGELFAFFVIGEHPEKSAEGCKYVSNNFTDTDLRQWFERLATDVVQRKRFDAADISSDVAKKILEPLVFQRKQVSEGGGEAEVEAADTAKQWIPVAFVYLLWISIFTVAQMLLTNTVEEKSNRIIEVLLSSLTPFQLMAGKIAGIALTGLTVLGAWVVFLIAGIKLVPLLFDSPMPFDLTVLLSDPVYLSSFLAYFLMGYLLFAALLVGIGAVCNSLKEAQNLQMPVTILLIVPLLAMVPIGQDPNGALARVLSYVPPFTPFVMMNRAAGPPPMIDYIATTMLLLASIVVAFWAAAKVFRIGVLMTGKPPRLKEIIRWVWAPVGTVPVRRDTTT